MAFTNIIQKCLAGRVKTTIFAPCKYICIRTMRKILGFCMALTLIMATPAVAQNADTVKAAADVAVADTALATSATDTSTELQTIADDEAPTFHQMLKTKFIEGDAGFMSLVALALVLGLAFCIERIIYLGLSDINARQFMQTLKSQVEGGDTEAARSLCSTTRGPVAALCKQGLDRMGEPMANIERTLVAFGSVQAAKLERGCSWIVLFIAMAPSLGFLGTVIGMVMAFDQIQAAGDISPAIVASGMRVALITTIFGIIVALILQVFYNLILSKIDRITCQMEETVIDLLDIIARYKGEK